jgi:hypothetical protein
VIPRNLDIKAQGGALRYSLLTDSWQALFGRALSSPDFGHGSQASNVIREAYETAQMYLDRETDLIAELTHQVAIEAQGLASRKIANIDADLLAVEAQTHLSETQQYLRDEIVAQIHRDIANVRQSLQRAVLDVSMIARTRKLKDRAAVVAWRLSNDETLSFNFTDRRAHRTPSAKFVRGLWRQTMLSIHNETTLFTIADHGLTSAGVFKTIEGVEEQVATIHLDGDGPTYGEIRSTLFHPNSNAYLGAI